MPNVQSIDDLGADATPGAVTDPLAGLERQSLEVLRFEPELVRSEVAFHDQAWRYEIDLEDWVTMRASDR